MLEYAKVDDSNMFEENDIPINISEWNFITNKTTKMKALFFLLPTSVPTSQWRVMS